MFEDSISWILIKKLFSIFKNIFTVDYIDDCIEHLGSLRTLV